MLIRGLNLKDSSGLKWKYKNWYAEVSIEAYLSSYE